VKASSFLLIAALGACAQVPKEEPRKVMIVPSASMQDEEGCPGVTGYTMVMPDGATISINVTTNLGPQLQAEDVGAQAGDVGIGPQVEAD